MKSVLIVGGSGHFGQLLAEDLSRYVDCELVIASRHSLPKSRYPAVVADLDDEDSLNRALTGITVAICAAGPFQSLPATLAELCIRRGIHYIDFADDRTFVRKVRSLVPPGYSGSAICPAWSTVSALSGALAKIGAAGLNEVHSIRIHMAPGNRLTRRKGTIAALLSSVGQPLQIFRGGRWDTVDGWSEPRTFPFRAPIGDQRGYLIDVPDHELLPALLGARTVEFRVGSELRILNETVSLLGWAVKRKIVRSWFPWSGLFQQAAALFSFIGHDWGAVGVEVAGLGGTRPVSRRASIIAETAGQRIAVMPASVMTSNLLADATFRGLVSPTEWIGVERLRMECQKRDFQLVVEET